MWSVSATGKKELVSKKIEAWTAPADDLNARHFAGAQAVIQSVLTDSPADCVNLVASGFHANDGRSELLIKIAPITLEV